MRVLVLLSLAASFAGFAPVENAQARSCKQLRALCWEMRSDDNDCTKPYLRCKKTGVFITPLGRRFVATSK